jgi:thioredoxin 1
MQVFVDFGATWCRPCKALAPAFHTAAVEFPNAVFLKVDVDACEDVASDYSIRAVPTIVVIKGGREIERVSGISSSSLAAFIAKHV